MFLKHVKNFSNTNNWHASSSLTWYLRMRVGRCCVTAYLTLLPAMRASWSISLPQWPRTRTKQLLVLVPSSFLPFQSGRSNLFLATLATSDFHNCISFSCRLVFPTIQQNSSPLALLSTFIEVTGKKLDNCAPVLDCRQTAVDISMVFL